MHSMVHEGCATVNRRIGGIVALCICAKVAEKLRIKLALSCTCVTCVQITKTAKLQRKHVDDVLGGDDAWKNVAKTEGE